MSMSKEAERAGRSEEAAATALAPTSSCPSSQLCSRPSGESWRYFRRLLSSSLPFCSYLSLFPAIPSCLTRLRALAPFSLHLYHQHARRSSTKTYRTEASVLQRQLPRQERTHRVRRPL